MFTLLEFDEVESTSSILKEHYASFPHFTVVRADYQSKGRGQFDRIWEAQKKKNLLMSVLLKELPIQQIEEIKQQTIAAILSVLEQYHIHASFKAPNDIYVDEHKICGILIETKAVQHVFEYAIIGIGLNVNQRKFGAYHATSMKNILSKTLDLKVVFYDVFTALEKTFLKGV